MTYYDSVKRIVRMENGQVEWIKVKRYKCKNCNTIHRELPIYIYPYKHYKSEIIEGVINGYITENTIGYEDYPCEMTMKRWRSQ